MRQVLEHLPEYSSLTAAAEVVARREGLGKETVRRWVVQAQIDGGLRHDATSEELAEIKDLKARVRRVVGGGQRDPAPGLDFLRVNVRVIVPDRGSLVSSLPRVTNGTRWLFSDVRPRSGALSAAGAWLDRSLPATTIALN